MKRFILALLLLLPLLGWSKIPDEEDIVRKIMDGSSPFYYTNLMMRYNNLEHMSEEEYHYLYYGFAYQNEYRPLESNEALDKLLLLASTLDIDHPEVKLLEQILVAGEEAMKRDPFNPQVLNLMAYAYGGLGNVAKEQAAYEQMRHVLMTIEDSGNGLSKDTPCHILMFGHALSLLSTYDLHTERAQIISREVEYIPLTTPRMVMGKKVKGYYFNYSRIYRNKPEGYVFKRDRTWQFNNLKPREYK